MSHSTPDPSTAPPPARRREQTRTAVAVILAVAITVFAVLNLDRVQVNWILGTWSTPLILVIAVSFLLGVGSDRLVLLRRARRTARG